MPSSRFSDALESAEMLVDFAARNSLDPDPELIRGVTHARALTAAENGAVNEEEEAKFFETYAKLAASIAKDKVTVGSIRDSSDQYGNEVRHWWIGQPRKISKARLAVRDYRAQTGLALFCLLMFQIYWIFGATLIDELSRIDKRNEELMLEKKQLATAPDPATAPQRRDAITAEQANLDSRIEVAQTLLRDWRGLRGFGRFFGGNLGGQQDDLFKQDQENRIQSENWLRIIQTYALPLIYGWVGACAYVLRQLVADTRERTYRDEARSAYGLRITLGVLAGLAVGWFSPPRGQR